MIERRDVLVAEPFSAGEPGVQSVWSRYVTKEMTALHAASLNTRQDYSELRLGFSIFGRLTITLNLAIYTLPRMEDLSSDEISKKACTQVILKAGVRLGKTFRSRTAHTQAARRSV